MENVISMKNVVKNYGKFAINNINLEVQKGYITGIIGKNGAGKTTIIKSILGMLTHDSGEIKIFGKEMRNNEHELKNKIGIVLGNGYFYSGITLKKMTKIIKDFYKNWDDETYKKYIDQFGLDERKKIKELSTGMRAKYNIALALSHNAELIIMDEPSSGLDPVAREELMDIFSEIIAEKEVTIVISTHITSDLDRTADYIVLINEGRLIFNLPKDELLDGHRIVKGNKDALTEDVKRELISYKISAHSFEGLTSDGVGMKSRHSGLLYEKPNVEDILRFYARD